MQCSFCPAPAEGSCFWPVPKYIEAEAQELQPGEFLQSHPSHEERFQARVLEVSPVRNGMIRLHLRLSKPEATRQTLDRRFEVNGFMRVMVLREAPCENLACEAHLMERGEGRVLCSAHWNAWEVKAA